MTIKYARVGAIVLTAASLTLLSSGTAAADPRGDLHFDVECDNGQSYSVVESRGGGLYTPVFGTDSNRVLIPVFFGPFSGAVYDAGSDELLGEFTDPAEGTKGSGKQRNTTDCTYSFTETFTVTEEDAAAGDPDDPEYLPAGTYRFEGGGSVVVKVSGRR